MGARNLEELGINLQQICSRLLSNDELVKLLYYTDKDPLGQENLTNDAKKKLLHDLVCIVPRIGTNEISRPTIVIYVPKTSSFSGNKEFKQVIIAIDIFVPLEQWIIKDSNLRPFAIMGKIQSSLNGKTINGLGKIQGGDFDLVTLTNEMSMYRQTFAITEYE